MAANYGEFHPSTYGDLGQAPVATYGEFGPFLAATSWGRLVLGEAAASLTSAEALVVDLLDSETLAVAMSVSEAAAAMASGESLAGELVTDEV